MADSITLIEKFDDTEILKQLDDIADVLGKIDAEGENVGETLTSTMDEANKYTKIFNDTLQKNSAEVAKNAESVAKSESNLKSWIAAQSQSIAGAQLMGKSVGEWAEKLKGLFVQQKAAAESANTLTESQKKLYAELTKEGVTLDQLKARYEALITVRDQDQAKIANGAKGAQSAKSLQNSLAAVNSEIQVTEAAIANFGKAGKEAADTLDKADTSTQKVSVSTKLLNLVLRASPWAILAGLVAKVIGFFLQFQTVADEVSQVTAALSAVLESVAGSLLSLGSAFVNLVQGNFSDAFDDLAASAEGLSTGLVNAAADAYNLEQRIQALRDAQIDASVSFARQKRVLDELKEASQDETLSYRERLKAIKEAGELEARIGKTKVDLATEARDIEIDGNLKEKKKLEDLVRGQASLKEIEDQRRRAQREYDNLQTPVRERIAAAEIALTEAIAEQEKERRDLDRESREIRKKASAERLKQLEDERKALEGLAKDLERLRVEVQQEGIERDLAAVEKKYDDLVAIVTKGEKTLSDVEKTRALTPEELAKRKELGDIAVQLEARRLEALLAVTVDYAEKDIDIELKRIKDKEALAKKDKDLLLKQIEDQRKLGDQEVDFIEAQGETVIRKLESSNAKESVVRQAKADLDELIQQKRLENEIAFNRRLLEVETDPTRVSEILATLKTLEEKLRGLDFGANGKGEKPKPLSIYDLLGIEDPAIRGGLDKVVDEIKNSIDEITKANVEAAQRRTEARQKEVDEAENFLKEQQDLNKEGLRNDLSLAKQQLEQKKAARDRAFKDEQQAKKIQLATDSIEQISSLITASTNIFKSLSAIPFVGVPLAIGLIGTMFGAFAIAKGKALSLINQSTPKLRQGKRISGRTHEAGGEDHFGVDGVRYEVEDLEYVIGTKQSKKHDKFLSRLNRGHFDNVDLNYLVTNGVRHENQLSAPARRIVQIEQDTRNAEAGHQHSAMVAAFTQGVERIVKATEEKAEYAPWKSGYKKVTRKGNTKTVETVLPSD